MKVVKVYGALKKRLGGQGTFELDVNTPAEAIKALTANFQGLDKWMVDSEQHGVGYKVQLGKEIIGEEQIESLLHPWSEREVFSITPVVTGAGRGFTNILIGAAMIGLAYMTAGASLSFQAGAGGIGFVASSAKFGLAAQLANFGLLMVLGGIAQMLSPTDELDMKEATHLQNYSFSGIVNTSQVGTPVPIAYGRVFVGSSVISSDLETVQEV
jgi:predicted phage tail protein